eukprot:3229342-Prorocentrum_lima.AAC.1
MEQLLLPAMDIGEAHADHNAYLMARSGQWSGIARASTPSRSLTKKARCSKPTAMSNHCFT